MLTKSQNRPIEPHQVAETVSTCFDLRPFVLPELLEVATNSEDLQTLEVLAALNSFSHRQDLVSAIASFLSDAEILSILSPWSAISEPASRLENLGRAIWSKSGLGQKLRPFKADQLVRKKLRGSLTDHYLSSLCASRRAIVDEVTAKFIQQLRTLVLIRSVEVLGQGIIRERILQSTAIALRLACESSIDPRLASLARVANVESDLVDFCSSIIERCDSQLKSHLLEDGDRRLFNSLRTIASKGPWRPELHISDLKNQLEWSPNFIREATSPAKPVRTELQVADADSAIHFLNGDVDSDFGLVAHETDENSPPVQTNKVGEGLILTSLEESQYLRHSWLNLSVAEERAVANRSKELLRAQDHVTRLGVALVAISTATGRTPKSVESLGVSKEIRGDWTLNPLNATLHRHPPRFERRWRAEKSGNSIAEWIEPLAPSWNISLSPELTQTLKSIVGKKKSFATLKDIWNSVSPEVGFSQWFAKEYLSDAKLGRISLTSLSHILPLRAYEQTQNQGFARLATAQIRSGLPAACAYGAYQSPLVRSALSSNIDLFTIVEPSAESSTNACGSELDIRLEKVREALIGLRDRLKASKDWVEYHNLLTCYTTLALLASTGSRPVNSPFESISNFDFTRSLMFVQDKISGPTLSSRVCVLSSLTRELILKVYLPHLADLATALKTSAPAFSKQIQLAAATDADSHIPLLFFVRAEPTLDWLEVSEKQLEIEGKLSWPVPWNLFRHIHATQLPRMGLDSEILDALLSHGDRNAETHGDFSLRVPRQDLNDARPLIERLQADLGFELPARFDVPLHIDVKPARSASQFGDRTYGKHARATSRENTNQRAVQHANSDIQRAIGSRPADSLSPEEWQGIATTMLFREDGLPHANASLRYQVFEGFVDKLWQRDRILTKVRRKFSVLPPPEPIFSEAFVHAPVLLEEVRSAFENVLQSISEQSIGHTLAGTLAAIDMVLHAHVAHRKALYALICQLPNIQLVKFNSSYWMEWSDAEKWRDGGPVFRVKITNRSAHWAAISRLSSRQLKEFPEMPKALVALLTDPKEPKAFKHFLDRLIEARAQMNAWEMPGTDAAYLSGRRIFSAIPHADWFRKSHPGSALLESVSTDDQDLDEEPVYFTEHHHKGHAPQSQSTTSLDCAKFIDDLKDTLLDDNLDTDAKASSVKRLLLDSPYRIGDIPFVFAHFGLHLLKRKRKKGVGEELRSTTVKRYLASLSGPVCDLAYDKSYYSLDEEEVTELYCHILDWWTNRQGSESDKLDPEKESRLSAKERAADAARRTLVQLREFHHFAETSCAADSPDWTQITSDGVGAIGRPGYILHEEYRRALKSIIAGRVVTDLLDDELGDCGTLILCKRFGTRLGEAVGATTDDWIDASGAIVVLVRPNAIRQLKTTNSKRQIPLIGYLEDFESAVIEELIRRSTLRHATSKLRSLIPGVDAETFVSKRTVIGTRLRSLLKIVTSNSHCVIHFTRHTFASDVFNLLRVAGDVVISKIPGADTLSTRRLLLAKSSSDRRCLWAVCRLLGHKSPAITAQCYVHGIEDFIPKPNSIGDWNGYGKGQLSVLDLDAKPLNRDYGKDVERTGAELQQSDSDFLKIFQYLRLRSQGFPEYKAAINAKLPREVITSLASVLARCGFTIDPTSAESTEERHQLATPLLSAIPTMRWDALCEIAEEAPLKCAPGPEFNLIETIGKRKQIVLFLPEHFSEFQSLVNTFKLDLADVSLVGSKERNLEFREWAKAVEKFEVQSAIFGIAFQLDSATTGSQHMSVRSRMVALPPPNPGKISTRIELLLLWIVWHFLRTQQPPTPPQTQTYPH